MGKVSGCRHGTPQQTPVPSDEMRELIRRVATWPRGLAFVDQGQLECVAIVFGVCPDVILEARRYLGTRTGRDWLLGEVRQAQRESPAPWQAARPYGTTMRPGPKTAAGLLRAAVDHEYGVSFLLESPPETAAVVFHVHPEMVFRARALRARWIRREGSKPSS